MYDGQIPTTNAQTLDLTEDAMDFQYSEEPSLVSFPLFHEDLPFEHA